MRNAKHISRMNNLEKAKTGEGNAPRVAYSVYAWSDFGGTHRFFIGAGASRYEAEAIISDHAKRNPSDHGYKVYRNPVGFYEPKDTVTDTGEGNAPRTLRYIDHVKNVSSVHGFVPNHEYDEVTAQRDELLAACKFALGYAINAPSSCLEAVMREAIAKAEGRAQ